MHLIPFWLPAALVALGYVLGEISAAVRDSRRHRREG